MPARTCAVPLDRSKPVRLPPHPDTRTNSWRTWAFARKRPRAIDLFAGCGGLSLGLEQAGYDVILSVDNDPWAAETHRHNLPGAALDLDLSDRSAVEKITRLLDKIPIDLVAGGPPCQPFSRAGRSKIRSLVQQGVRAEEDHRAALWQVFLEVVERVRPQAVLMENVPDMALGDDLTAVRVIAARLEKLGFEVDARLIDAWRHGVPQHRQRLILIGRRDGLSLKWPRPHKRRITLRDAIFDLPPLAGGTGDLKMKARAPRNSFQRRMRRGTRNGELWDHVTRPVRDDDREAFRLLKPGMRYSDLPKRLRRYRDDIFDDKYNRLAWNDVSRSITAHIAKDGYWYIHPSELRTLTVREAARIQTFPDRFRFAGTRSHAFRQIGNAVPPALGEALGRELLDPKPTQTGRAQAVASREQLERIRSKLQAWGRHDSRSAPWRHPCDPWCAAVGVLLADRLGGADHEVRAFLKRFPRPVRGSAAEIRRYATELPRSSRRAAERLAHLAEAIVARTGKEETWNTRGGLGPQEEALVRLIGLQEDTILATASALRVASRLTGLPVDQGRRLSDGRMLLARIVGIEPHEPRLNPALHALGRVVCTPAAPSCEICPLLEDCKFGR
jgi:DNA (cytosine-5)-methyltransferase 1